MSAEIANIEGATRARAGLLTRILGIVLSPRDTFVGVVAAPRVFGVLAFVALVGALAVGGFLFTDVGQQAWLDQSVSQSEAWGRPVTDEQYAGMERMAPYVGYIGIAQMIGGIPLLLLVLSGILYAIFTAGLGGNATFKQLYAVAAHSTAIWALGWIFVMPLNYVRETLSSPTNLSALLPMLDEGSFLAGLLGAVDLFLVWWTVVLAIGLAVLYRRRTQSMIVSLLAVYAVVAVVIAGVRSALGGS
jgi:hypothetical protein